MSADGPLNCRVSAQCTAPGGRWGCGASGSAPTERGAQLEVHVFAFPKTAWSLRPRQNNNRQSIIGALLMIVKILNGVPAAPDGERDRREWMHVLT